ncbi:histidine phosphatase family protein [Streptococcus pacificus]|uniref:Histidine phosphatase family protein n=1 Tax=Streptococcus pacificus TaxID=2740577 RepID=A0ABS0ZJW7_9STRE|nr:histidine phosphatase family protein [Streptococcus pacificus]MBJ8326321.1 histidine phosphatase family protein [Streptococcus pacificus]
MKETFTTIYLVRHAQPNYENHNDCDRELTTKGLQDSQLISVFLKDKAIHSIYSSPYRRSIETIESFSKERQLSTTIDNLFRERKIDDVWIEDFNQFAQKQWLDFNYKLTNGESLNDVKHRMVNAINNVLDKEKGNNVVVGSHGTAISTLIHHYSKSFNYHHFEEIKTLMPFIAEFIFKDKTCLSIKVYNLFTGDVYDHPII